MKNLAYGKKASSCIAILVDLFKAKIDYIEIQFLIIFAIFRKIYRIDYEQNIFKETFAHATITFKNAMKVKSNLKKISW